MMQSEMKERLVEVEKKDLQALCRLTYELLLEMEKSETIEEALEFVESFVEKINERERPRVR